MKYYGELFINNIKIPNSGCLELINKSPLFQKKTSERERTC